MISWKLKAVTQKFISFLPYKHKINYVFQRFVTKGLVFSDELFDSKLHHFKQHIEAWKKYCNIKPLISLELGTGWHPVVPVGLFLAGAEKIYTADIESLLNGERTKQVIAKYITYHQQGILADRMGSYDLSRISLLEEILANEDNLTRIIEKLYIQLLVGDVVLKASEIKEKITLIHSNNTLEHIPEQDLRKLLLFFRQLISPMGVMSHFIDLSDHFSHLDKKITPYNFLHYSDSTWKLIDNSIQPQNRLRISDYRRLFIQAGWLQLNEESIFGNNSDLKSIRLSSKFVKNAEVDNLVTHSLVICKPS